MSKPKFKALVRKVMANLTWLSEVHHQDILTNLPFVEITEKTIERTRDSGLSGDTFNLEDFRSYKTEECLVTTEIKDILKEDPELRTPEQIKLLVDSIPSFDCLACYSKKLREDLIKVLVYQCLESGRVVVKQGHPGTGFYFILGGSVMVRSSEYDEITGNTFSFTVSELTTGDTFGELALIHDAVRTASIITKEPVELLRLDKEYFDELLKEMLKSEWDKRFCILKNVSLFKTWKEQQLYDCCNHVRLYSYGKHVVLLSNVNTQQEYINFVVSGRCAVIREMIICHKDGILLPKHVQVSHVERKSIYPSISDRLSQIFTLIPYDGNYSVDLPSSPISTLSSTRRLRIISSTEIRSLSNITEMVVRNIPRTPRGRGEAGVFTSNKLHKPTDACYSTLSHYGPRRTLKMKELLKGCYSNVSKARKETKERDLKDKRSYEKHKEIRKTIFNNEAAKIERSKLSSALIGKLSPAPDEAASKMQKLNFTFIEDSEEAIAPEEPGEDSSGEGKEADERPMEDPTFSFEGKPKIGGRSRLPRSVRLTIGENKDVDTLKLPFKLYKHFIQIAALEEGHCFGLGEDLSNIHILTQSNVKILQVPFTQFLKHEQTNALTMTRKHLNYFYPSEEDVVRLLHERSKWMMFRKEVIADILQGRKSRTQTTIDDVPYTFRVPELF